MASASGADVWGAAMADARVTHTWGLSAWAISAIEAAERRSASSDAADAAVEAGKAAAGEDTEEPKMTRTGSILYQSAELRQADRIFLTGKCVFEAGTLVDATAGPVHIGRDCVIHAGSRVIGCGGEADTHRKVPAGTTIGDGAVIGFGCEVRAQLVGSHAVVGAGAVLGEGCIVCDHAVVEPGVVVPPGAVVPPLGVATEHGVAGTVDA